ncbi:MarR family transcriptional regulator for hemolysin [Streptacidiphilus sp. MAP12-16]|uniref:MarR family winged helix-turn-helix transcriptional regulator n=1 Tax=Streptacidiphilus sp. MAP12-16 TaxID=3156300 RepID=UPI0035162F4E
MPDTADTARNVALARDHAWTGEDNIEKAMSDSADAVVCNTPGPESGDRASDELGPAVLTLGRAYLGAVAAILDTVPHGPRGYHTLCAVIRGNHPSQLVLASQLGIDRTVMTYLIDDLVSAGLVERQLNPADRRQRKIVATPSGTQTMTELTGRVREVEDELLSALDNHERKAFRDLLRRAVGGLRDSDNSSPC